MKHVTKILLCTILGLSWINSVMAFRYQGVNDGPHRMNEGSSFNAMIDRQAGETGNMPDMICSSVDFSGNPYPVTWYFYSNHEMQRKSWSYSTMAYSAIGLHCPNATCTGKYIMAKYIKADPKYKKTTAVFIECKTY